MSIKVNSGGGVILSDSGKISCTCCVCPQPTIQWDSRSASKTKCGISEFGTASSPPKIYTTVSQSGGFTSGTLSNTYSGEASYDANCVIDYTPMVETVTNSDPDPDFSYTFDISPGYAQAGQPGYVFLRAGCIFNGTLAFSIDSDVTDVSTTVRTYGVGASPDFPTTGTVTVTLSNEYTTATLIANALAALPAFDDDWNDTAGSYYNLTTDELTNSIREAKYRFAYTVPSEGSCYRIEWMEGSTPKSWQWDGTGTEGDPAYTPEITIPIPTTNETVTVTDVVAYCADCV